MTNCSHLTRPMCGCPTAPVNVMGNSGVKIRGNWCSPKWLALLLGHHDIDPCSNPRSHIQAVVRLMLENFGDDGLAGEPGQYLRGGKICATTSRTRSFVNNPYGPGIVEQWVDHWAGVTDHTFLLRWDPSTAWFDKLMGLTNFVWFPDKRAETSRINFEPPPGVEASSQAFPHALYMRSRPNDALMSCGRVFVAG